MGIVTERLFEADEVCTGELLGRIEIQCRLIIEVRKELQPPQPGLSAPGDDLLKQERTDTQAAILTIYNHVLDEAYTAAFRR